MFQQITIAGRLGQNPELRYTPSGVPVATFSLATSKKFADASGNQQEKTVWFRVTAWRKQAETVGQYLTKGSKVLVVGEVEDARPFTDKAGNNRASLEVTANTIRFLDSKDAGSTEPAATQPAQSEPVSDDPVPW
jgi:single-strand DNA-binding protein